MARPRQPAKILDLRGAFAKNPARRREDAEGDKPFNSDPPAHLPEGAVRAWRYVVERLPKVAMFNCDEIAVEIAATLLAQFWLSRDIDTLKELRQWLAKLGMTPVDRTKIPPADPGGKSKNPFSEEAPD